MNMKSVMLVLLACSLFAVVGCSGSDATGDDGTDDDGTGKPSGSSCVSTDDTSGVPTINATVAITEIASSNSTAMNTLDESGSPLTSKLRPALAGNSCGNGGLIFIEPAENTLRYLDFSTANVAGEVIDDDVNWPNKQAALIFDADCTALVLTVDSTDGLVQYSRDSAGVWTKNTYASGLSGNNSLELVMAKTGSNGDLAVFVHSGWGDDQTGVLYSRKNTAGASWTAISFTPPTAQNIFDYALDAKGTIHAVYSPVNIVPCDPCDNDLYWGVHSAGGKWTSEVVQESKWGEPDDQYASQASLLIGSDGTPYIAACYLRRAVTGSMKETELRMYGIVEEEWCNGTIAKEQNGYAGGDGTKFTGHDPQLATDDVGRIYLLFHDRTQWHDSTGANGIVGQPRLAVLSAEGWSLATLYKQTGQQESPKPLYGFRFGAIAPNADGSKVMLVGVESKWETDSIYNNTDLPISYKLLAREIGIVR